MVTATRQISQAYWWSLVIRAIVALLFGIAALLSPLFVGLFLIYLFGAYALLDGILAVIVSLQDRQASSRWWVLLLGGIAGIILGLFAFFQPAVTAVAFFWIIAAWLVITGVFEIISAFTPGAPGIEWLLVVVGVLSILVGIVFFLHPTTSILTIVWLLGVFALIYGIIQIVRAIQLRSLLSA
jgi:uncharacterized membrane protein HdeD (DUF308 family)